MNIVKYLDPRNDIAFKKIFGSEKNKDILLHFLNDILHTQGKHIKEVTLLNGEQHPSVIAGKQSIIDVLCKDENGAMFIVEMQVSKVQGFEKRAQYYAAKAYANQMKEGEKYHHLKEVIFVAIVDYTMFPDKEAYKSDHVILDKESYEHDLKDFSFTFIELPKFKKKRVEDLHTYEEKWCYFFKHSSKEIEMDKLLEEDDKVIGKAYEELRAYHWKESELRAYEAMTKANMDAQAREDYVKYEAREEGLAEGRAEGMAKGRAEGMAKGRAEGMAKGRAEGMAKGKVEGKLEMAKSMLSKGMDINLVSELPGLHVEDIKES